MPRLIGGRVRYRGPLSTRPSQFRVPKGGLLPKMSFKFVRAKSFFLDRRQWDGILSDGERSALAASGGYIRTTARRSMRSKDGPAPPGRPPHAHGRRLLRKFLNFWLERNDPPDQYSMICGPEFIPSLHKDVNPLTQGTIPRTLELGGVEVIKTDYIEATQIGTFNRTATRKTIYIEARPYMNPALRKSLPAIRENFRDFIAKAGVKVRRVA